MHTRQLRCLSMPPRRLRTRCHHLTLKTLCRSEIKICIRARAASEGGCSFCAGGGPIGYL